MAAIGTEVPALVLEPDHLPGEQQFEIFHDTAAPLFATEPLVPVTRFRAGATDHLVDDLVVSSVRFGRQSLRRTTRHLAPGDTDWLGLVLPRRGALVGECGRSEDVRIAPGGVTMIDFAEAFALRSDDAEVVMAAIPRERLADTGRSLPDGALTIDEASEDGRAIVAAVGRICARLRWASAVECSVLADDLVEVVRACLAPGPAGPPEPTLESMKSYVRANLRDLDLGVGTLRSRFHCSRSAVYRIFEPEGGVVRFIREERLRRCYRELSAPTTTPRKVSEVATRWGFENPSHFHRLFTSAFGAPPSSVLADARARAERRAPDEPDTSHLIRRFHDWATGAAGPRRSVPAGP